MENNIHLNDEYIKGFVEALIYQLDYDLGPFLKDLQCYNIIFKKEETGLYKVEINYSIDTDDRDLKVYFELGEKSKLEAFRLKVELAVEEIIERIRRFDKKTFANENPDE